MDEPTPTPVPASAGGRHQPGPEPRWNESWYFDWAQPDGSLGGYAGGLERKRHLLAAEGVREAAPLLPWGE